MSESSVQLAENIAKQLDDYKGQDIKILQVKEITLVAEYFVLVTGTSTTHVQSLADNLMEELKVQGVSPLQKEGLSEGDWVLIDYDSVIVHVFSEESREFYNLERLWAEAEEVSW